MKRELLDLWIVDLANRIMSNTNRLKEMERVGIDNNTAYYELDLDTERLKDALKEIDELPITRTFHITLDL